MFANLKMIKPCNGYGKPGEPFLPPSPGRSTADAPKRASKPSPSPRQGCSRSHGSQKITHGSSARHTEPVSLSQAKRCGMLELPRVVSSKPLWSPKCHQAVLQCCRKGLPSADKQQPCMLPQQALPACSCLLPCLLGDGARGCTLLSVPLLDTGWLPASWAG